MTLYEIIRGDPELRAKDKQLTQLSTEVRGAHDAVEAAVGRAGKAAARIRLSEVRGRYEEAMQGRVYDRWKGLYDDSFRKAFPDGLPGSPRHRQRKSGK